MSLEAYVWVTRYAPVPRVASARLVLYGLAEHAHKDGTNSFPGMQRLSEILGGNTTANRKKVQRALNDLESGGWITCTAGDKYHFRRWKLNYAHQRDDPVVGEKKKVDLYLLSFRADGHECPPNQGLDGHECPPQMDMSVPMMDTSVSLMDKSVDHNRNEPSIEPEGEPGLSPFDPNLDRTDPRRLTTEIPGIIHLNDLTDSDLKDKTKQKCHQHIGQGYVKDNCGACGHVKHLFRQEAEYRQAKQRQEDQRRRQGIDQCADCDDFGWLKSAKLERGEFIRCQHIQEDAA